MIASSEEVKLAIIGCGAITQARYLPAANLLPNLTITHVVDLDAETGHEVANRFQIPEFAREYQQVFGKVDAVVVATPPSSHARISIDCLNHGLHVLCEKPLAVSVMEAKAMISASQRSNRHLAVGMNRRLSWSSQISRRLVQSGVLGDIYRFDIEEGHEFNWPLRTGHIFQDSNAGGVLADTGVHVFDLLLWTLGSPKAKLGLCRTDNWGGVEANAVVELVVEWHSRQTPGGVELSFTRELRNTMRIYGDNGVLEAPILGGLEVSLYLADNPVEPVILTPHHVGPRNRVEEFAVQLSKFVEAVLHDSKTYVTADEALATLSLIEQCHYGGERMGHAWETVHLEPFFEGKGNE